MKAASDSSPPVSGALPRPPRDSRPIIAMGGRVVVVWLAVAMIASAARPLDTGGLLAVTLAAAIWLICLHAASAGAPFTLGPRVPAAIGTLTGLVCVGAINPLMDLVRYHEDRVARGHALLSIGLIDPPSLDAASCLDAVR